MSDNNFGNDIFTPPSTDETLVTRRKLSIGAIAGIVLGAIAGTVVVGTIVGILLTYMYARKKAHFADGPYGVCGTNNYQIVIYSFGTRSGVPDPSNNDLLTISCTKSNGSTGGIAKFPTVYSKQPGIYIVQFKNYVVGGEDLDKVKVEAVFIADNEILSEFQTGVVLDEIMTLKPTAAALFAWGNATKILRDKNVIAKLQKMGATELTSITSYEKGSPYIFFYEKSRQKGSDELGKPESNLKAGPFNISHQLT